MIKRILVIAFVLCILSAVTVYASPYIDVDYEDGSQTSTEASKVTPGTKHFHVEHSGIVTGATAYDELDSITWNGQHGAENADASDYESAVWHWVWNKKLLTISDVEFGCVIEPPIVDPPTEPPIIDPPIVDPPTEPPVINPPVTYTSSSSGSIHDYTFPVFTPSFEPIALPRTDGVSTFMLGSIFLGIGLIFKKLA